eukprot:TRINITY_DN13381_c0_g1_i1.p1 TRINITY_DN13381_c0_g1~~TRINITY_DN13381_c0_g1_i1.p1  ORF type:complete len:821 (+),score=122.97 TRINITY_DN13381_c0_g1_i1:24-2486(+)
MRSNQFYKNGYELFTDVSVRAPLSQLRQSWNQTPKYFKNIPKHAYQLNWSPVISTAGQDIEVDPYDRISKKGVYSEMIPNWQSWYQLENLMISRDAPESPLQIAQDLSQTGVQLNDYNSSVLMWKAVSQIEAGIKMGAEDRVRQSIETAGLLKSTLDEFHTIGLETSSALAAMYGLTKQRDEIDKLELTNRHLLSDPEEPLDSKRSLYEHLSLAGVLMEDDEMMTKWQSVLHQKKIAPSTRYWTILLYHLREQKKPTLMLEAKKNMEMTCEKDNKIYYMLSSIAGLCAQPELATNLQLEMKSEALLNPNKLQYSARFMHESHLTALVASKDMVGALSAWQRLKLVNTSIRYRDTGKHTSKLPYQPTRKITATILGGFEKAKDAYKWWRQEALGIGGLLHKVGFGGHVLNVLTNRLVDQREWTSLTELHGELLRIEKRSKDSEKMHLNTFEKPTTIKLSGSPFWRNISIGLAHAGYLQEAHTVLIKRINWSRYPFKASMASHLFTCTSTRADRDSDLVLSATVESIQSNKYWDLDGDSYLYVVSHQLALEESIDFGLRTFRELTNVSSLFPTDKGFSFLLGWAGSLSPNDDKLKNIKESLLPHLWQFYLRGSMEKYGKISFLVGRLFQKLDPGLPGLGQYLLSSIPGFYGTESDYQFELHDIDNDKEILVLDGTTAFNVEDYVSSNSVCLLPQSVLCQLYSSVVSPTSTATVKEKDFFSDSLNRFLQALSTKDIQLITLTTEETLLGTDSRNLGTPQRIAALTSSLSLKSTAKVITNDVMMARYCDSQMVNCTIPNKHSRQSLEGALKTTTKGLPPNFDTV